MMGLYEEDQGESQPKPRTVLTITRRCWIAISYSISIYIKVTIYFIQMFVISKFTFKHILMVITSSRIG